MYVRFTWNGLIDTFALHCDYCLYIVIGCHLHILWLVADDIVCCLRSGQSGCDMLLTVRSQPALMSSFQHQDNARAVQENCRTNWCLPSIWRKGEDIHWKIAGTTAVVARLLGLLVSDMLLLVFMVLWVVRLFGVLQNCCDCLGFVKVTVKCRLYSNHSLLWWAPGS